MTTNNVAGRGDFLTATARRFKEIPLFGGKTARIRSLTAGEYADIDARNIDTKKGGLSASGVKLSDLRLFVASVCDGDGQQLFTDADLPALGGVDAALVLPTVREIKEHCGLRNDAEASLKNSDGTATGDSPTSS